MRAVAKYHSAECIVVLDRCLSKLASSVDYVMILIRSIEFWATRYYSFCSSEDIWAYRRETLAVH
jgi:hypothetical protein